MSYLDRLMTHENEHLLLFWMSYGMILFGFLSFLVLLLIPAPYGRYSSTSWGFLIDSRYAWFMQEVPSLVLPVVFWLSSEATIMLPNKLLLCAFIAHYTHRSLIYPLLMKRGSTTTLVVFLICVVFCLCNGYLQSRYLLYFAVYPPGWTTSKMFLCGLLLFISGMCVNIHSDHILRSLRQWSDHGDTSYKIPRGGMFKYVSCANYFGEMIEWTGFAVACWSLPATAFALFTVLNLAPRALFHHRWYVKKFEDYPIGRKALIPFIL